MGIIYFMDGIVDLYYSPKINPYFKIQKFRMNSQRITTALWRIRHLIFDFYEGLILEHILSSWNVQFPVGFKTWIPTSDKRFGHPVCKSFPVYNLVT